MIPRQRFIARIRSLGYRKAGGTHYLSVPMRERLSETYVRSALTQAGCSESDIRAFLDDAASQ